MKPPSPLPLFTLLLLYRQGPAGFDSQVEPRHSPTHSSNSTHTQFLDHSVVLPLPLLYPDNSRYVRRPTSTSGRLLTTLEKSLTSPLASLLHIVPRQLSATTGRAIASRLIITFPHVVLLSGHPTCKCSITNCHTVPLLTIKKLLLSASSS